MEYAEPRSGLLANVTLGANAKRRLADPLRRARIHRIGTIKERDDRFGATSEPAKHGSGILSRL
jgi:hypothetical protein